MKAIGNKERNENIETLPVRSLDESSSESEAVKRAK
jgi:hypothetical protein